MKQYSWLLWVALTIAVLLFARHSRTNSNNSRPSGQTVATKKIGGGVELEIIYARKSASGAPLVSAVELLGEGDVILHSFEPRGQIAYLEPRDDVQKIRIRAQHHKDYVMLWPESKTYRVVMEADTDFLTNTPKLPKTTGDDISTIKISEEGTQHVLADVEVFLDGRLVGDSKTTGLCVLPLSILKKAKEMVFKKPGYKTKKITLTVGKIDEFHVEGVFLEKEYP